MNESLPPTRILVVDDEESIRLLLKLFLEGKGYEVEIATNLKEAITRQEKATFEAAIVDKNLPDGFGFDFATSLSKSNSDCVVLIMTAYADVQSATKARNLGVVDFLIKPFSDLEEIHDRICRALKMRSFRISNREFEKKIENKKQGDC